MSFDVYNWLAYAPIPGMGKHPWGFRREVLDPMLGSAQPHFMFREHCFQGGDFSKPQPDEVVKHVQGTAAGSLGDYYADVVILNIEHSDFENLSLNWNPMRERGPNGEWWYCVERNAMAKLRWFVWEVKLGLGASYKVGLWNHLPSWRMHLLFKGAVATRDRWWNYAESVAPLGEVVDFTVPHFYWVLDPGDPAYFTLEERRRGIQLSCMASHEIYGKPCYPCVWPECYRAFQEDPWPDTEERQRARQWSIWVAEVTLGAVRKYGDGMVLWSQPLQSAPGGAQDRFTPFRFDYPWWKVLWGIANDKGD
jgi:hypothetical protein